MSLSPIKETQSAALYVFCVLLTSVLIAFKPLLGLLSILWGFLGFYRYLYLNSANNIKIPKVLTLPSRILFDLTQDQKQAIDSTIQRLLQKDIIAFFLFTLVFIMWGIYCSLQPLELALFQSFWEDKKDFIPSILPTNHYAILEKISYSLIMILIVFIGLTYYIPHYLIRYPPTKFLWALLLPLIALLIYIFINLPYSAALLQMNFSHFKGIGWGKFEAFQFLSNENADITDTQSGFFKRYIETGLVGALGLYIIFIPIILTLVRNFVKHSRTPHALSALILLITMAILDFFWLAHPFILSAQMLVLAYSALILRHFCSHSCFDHQKP